MRCEVGTDVIPEECANRIWNRPCLEWADRQKVGLGWFTAPKEWFGPRFEVLRRRSPWLDCIKCRTCGTLWYVAVDTRDDDYYFLRLTEAEAAQIFNDDVWPVLFDVYDRFWPKDIMRRIGLVGMEETFVPPPRKATRGF